MSKGFGFNFDHLNVTAEDWSVIKAYEGREPHPPQASKVIDLSEGVIGRKASIETRSASGRRVNIRGARRALDLMLADGDSMTKSRPDDIAPKPSDTHPMNDITREELDAKLDATNARVEARLSSFEGMIRETLAAVRQDSAEMRGELKVMHSELSGLKNIKGSIWGAAGATIIGVGGILAAMLSFGIANYDAGRETSQLVEAAKLQTQDTRKLLEQIQAQQKSLVTPKTAEPSPPAK